MLAVSGKLDLTMGGPGFDLFEPNDNYVRVYTPKTAFGPAEFRRMIYQSKPRMQQDDTFGAFDCPDAGQIAPKRTRSTTPLQALNLLNSPFMHPAGRVLRRARRSARPATTPAKQVQRAFRARASARRRRATELAAADEAGHASTACRALPGAVQRERVRVRGLTHERPQTMHTRLGRSTARPPRRSSAHAGTGLGGIALAALLAEQGLLARRRHADPCPTIRPTRRLRRGRRTSPPKAKRVLVHLLLRRAAATSTRSTTSRSWSSGTASRCPAPTSSSPSRARTATSSKPLWEFKPRGQSGKMISDLLPHLAELADEMCFIHSMTAKSNTHGPAENQMSTGFTLDGFPSMGAWVSYALGQRGRGPARVRRHPRSARRAADRAEQLGQRLPARRVPGHRRSTPTSRSRTSRRPPAITPPADDGHARLPEAAQRRAPRRSIPATPSSPRASPATSWPRGCSSRAAEVGDLSQRNRRHAATTYGADDAEHDQGRLRPELPARPPAARARRAVRAALQRRLRDGRGRRQLGRPQDAQGAVRRPRADPRPARRRAAHAT